MGKNKLRKFREMEEIPFVLQYPWGALQKNPFPHRSAWKEFFGNSNPVTLELGCGKGEYTVELATRHPERNFIGIDVKGARMWTGARQAVERGLRNIAFIRTDIEMLDSFFAPGEVAEIWITFPDPQMQKPRKRLTGPRMLKTYRKALAPGARINLKTDSPFLYSYTSKLCALNGLEVETASADVYADAAALPAEVTDVRTHYENQWLERGLTIKYLRFDPGSGEPLVDVARDDMPEKDTYRSYSRGQIQMPQLTLNG